MPSSCSCGSASRSAACACTVGLSCRPRSASCVLSPGSDVERRLRARGELARLRDLLIAHCRRPLHQRDHRQGDRDDQRDRDRGAGDAQTFRRPLPAAQHIRCLQFGGRRLLPGLASDPVLRLLQLGTGQQKARVVLVGFPFQGLASPPSVRLDPVEVRFDRSHEDLQRPLEVVLELAALGHELMRRQALGQILRIDGAYQHPDHALAQRLGMLELTRALRRGGRVRADQEHERVGGLDRLPEVVTPARRWRNVLLVDPDFLAALHQRRVQPQRELLIVSGVGKEDIRHVSPRVLDQRYGPMPCR